MLDPSLMQSLLQNTKTTLNNASSSLTSYAVVLSALGVTSMALVQTLKDQTPLRQKYQRMRICKWLKEGETSWNSKSAGAGNAHAQPAELDMVTLAADGDSKAFYALEIEKLCGQLNAAAQTVLDDPSNHPDLLKILASEALPADVTTMLAGPGPIAVAPAPPTLQQTAYATARNRITSQIRRAVDGLQISVGGDWQTRLQQASLLLSIAMAEVIVYYSPTLRSVLHPYWFGGAWFFFALFLGTIGGFLAPISRDLIAALQSLRT